MGEQQRESEAVRLMVDFAERTGLTTDRPPRRYLWTDAFALHNFLTLDQRRGGDGFRDRAREFIDQVHHVLGRHRPDEPRSGWLSGLPEEEGARRPTLGGLRIGKPLPERDPHEPADEQAEWDRDGQYFHYLTKWMDALARAASALNEPAYQGQAVDLAKAVFPRFLRTAAAGTPIGLSWKMSIDLSRPLVSGMSPYDALDGYVTFRRIGRTGPRVDLEGEIEILRLLSAGRTWGTDDPLGIGGLLSDAVRLAILPDRTEFDEHLIIDVLHGADVGLRHFRHGGSLEAPSSRRLAFRELGLAIGLQAEPVISSASADSTGLAKAVAPHVMSLRSMAGVGDRVVSFWADRERHAEPLWQDHRDINEVMLATALLGPVTPPRP